MYIAKVAYDYMVLVLVRWLRCSLLSFSFRAFLLIWFVSLLVGALCVEVGFGDLEAFLQCSFFGEVGFIDFETRSCSFLLGSLVNEVDFDDLEV